MQVVHNRKSLAMRPADQSGVGLIEVLIALAIFAVGVGGMAGLQLRTLSLTMDSAQRTIVVSKSQDIADRIRSSGIAPKEYLSGATAYNADWCTATEGAVSCSDDATGKLADACSAANMTVFDLYDAFCVTEDDEGGPQAGGFQAEVAEWQVGISCAYPDPVTGEMNATTECDEIGATLTVSTTWFARSAVDGTDSDGNTITETDSMSLSFIP